MSDHCTVDFEPLGRRVQVDRGTTLLAAAREAGVGLNALCGGGGTCNACRVRIAAGEVSPPTTAEENAVSEGLRLACQTRILGDLRVDVPPSSVTAPQRAQIEGRVRQVALDSAVRAFDVTLSSPSPTDLRSDVTRLRDALTAQHGVSFQRVAPVLLPHIPALLRQNGWKIRVVINLDTHETIAALPKDEAPLGLAVDIGTTKLAGYLVDLESGDTLASAGAMNPQIAYGEDVMARIAYAMENEQGEKELQRVLITGLNDLVERLCAQAERDRNSIVDGVLVGNTCMHHLVLGLPVNALGLAPYVPLLSDACDIAARDLELALAPGAGIHLLPNIAGFVGADHVAMGLAVGIHETNEVTLGLDIGTNTEIVLAANGRLLSCSCASGPAFEGAHIRDGMRAAPGAIEYVRLSDGRVEYQTIGDQPPVGLCGSGILDGVAELRRIGVLNPTGSMALQAHPRVRKEGRRAAFVIVSAGEDGAQRDLLITREDVNEIQLAKAAIRGGIEVLLNEADITIAQIEHVVVAGAFGTYLDVASAIAIDMFPPLPRERFSQVGNAAGAGAKMALLSRRCREEAKRIMKRVEYVELTANPRFVDAYTEALLFPG